MQPAQLLYANRFKKKHLAFTLDTILSVAYFLSKTKQLFTCMPASLALHFFPHIMHVQ